MQPHFVRDLLQAHAVEAVKREESKGSATNAVS